MTSPPPSLSARRPSSISRLLLLSLLLTHLAASERRFSCDPDHLLGSPEPQVQPPLEALSFKGLTESLQQSNKTIKLLFILKVEELETGSPWIFDPKALPTEEEDQIDILSDLGISDVGFREFDQALEEANGLRAALQDFINMDQNPTELLMILTTSYFHLQVVEKSNEVYENFAAEALVSMGYVMFAKWLYAMIKTGHADRLLNWISMPFQVYFQVLLIAELVRDPHTFSMIEDRIVYIYTPERVDEYNEDFRVYHDLCWDNSFSWAAEHSVLPISATAAPFLIGAARLATENLHETPENVSARPEDRGWTTREHLVLTEEVAPTTPTGDLVDFDYGSWAPNPQDYHNAGFDYGATLPPHYVDDFDYSLQDAPADIMEESLPAPILGRSESAGDPYIDLIQEPQALLPIPDPSEEETPVLGESPSAIQSSFFTQPAVLIDIPGELLDIDPEPEERNSRVRDLIQQFENIIALGNAPAAIQTEVEANVDPLEVIPNPTLEAVPGDTHETISEVTLEAISLDVLPELVTVYEERENPPEDMGGPEVPADGDNVLPEGRPLVADVTPAEEAAEPLPVALPTVEAEVRPGEERSVDTSVPVAHTENPIQTIAAPIPPEVPSAADDQVDAEGPSRDLVESTEGPRGDAVEPSEYPRDTVEVRIETPVIANPAHRFETPSAPEPRHRITRTATIRVTPVRVPVSVRAVSRSDSIPDVSSQEPSPSPSPPESITLQGEEAGQRSSKKDRDVEHVTFVSHTAMVVSICFFSVLGVLMYKLGGLDYRT